MFLTDKRVRKIIREELEKYGMKEEKYFFPFVDLYLNNTIQPDSDYKIEPLERLREKVEKLKEKVDILAKHFGLEYYRKETRETNGQTKRYIKEGFRKIKKPKIRSQKRN
jgi:hypothetical protein